MATQRGRKWQVNIRFEGRLVRKSFDTKLEADTWELLAKDARDNGKPLPPVSSKDEGASGVYLKPFIDDVFQDLWGQNSGWEKSAGYCKEIVAFFGEDYPISKFTTAEYDRFIKHLRGKGNSDSTLNRKTSCLSKLLKKAVAREVLAKLPVMERRKEGKGRKRFLTEAEEVNLLRTLRALGHEQAAWRCQFMIYTGARDGEVRNLQWSDVNGRRVTLDGKTGHRPLTVPQKAMDALSWCREQGYLKPFPMAYETFKEAWDKAAVKLGYADDPTWVPYVMRHTCASRLVQRGVDIRRVRDWMGHSTINTTMVYVHLAPDDLDVCAKALDDDEDDDE